MEILVQLENQVLIVEKIGVIRQMKTERQEEPEIVPI